MSAAEKTYNGWKNYETWTVMLHLDNDEETYTMVRERAEALDADAPRYELAMWLKEFAETLCGMGDESEEFGIPEPTLLAMDMIRAALSEVDWDEMAAHVLSES
jgi:hypothetical protein